MSKFRDLLNSGKDVIDTFRTLTKEDLMKRNKENVPLLLMCVIFIVLALVIMVINIIRMFS